MTHTLHALVLQLIAQESGTLPVLGGELAHAAFYALVQAVDPALAAQMHDAQERSLFSLSPLYGFWQSPQGPRGHPQIRVGVGQEGWLRLGLLDERLFQVFLEYLLHRPLPVIRLGNVQFLITQIYGAPGSHPWVGYTTLDELRQEKQGAASYVLDFASPTAIRWGEADNKARRVELFPQPRMALAGLRSRWDRLTGETWGRLFEEWVERNVIIGRIWQWQTQTVPFQKQRYQGGLGKVEYRVLDQRRADYVAHLHRLLQLAFYTGIGYKTTHGLGQVRLLSTSAAGRVGDE